jgi:ABC-type multidrug transport system ATPase subunit
MDRALLEYLIRLFAIIANIFPSLLFENVKDFIKSFLLKEFSPDVADEYLRLFNEYYKKFSNNRVSSEDAGYLHIKLVRTIKEINKDIPKKQKFQILVRLLFFDKFFLKYALKPAKDQLSFDDVLNLVIEYFQIESIEFNNCKSFVSDTLYNIPQKENLLIVGAKKGFMLDINFLQHENLPGQLFFLYIESAGLLLFYYKGSVSLTLNNNALYPNQVYLFNKGFSIKGSDIEPIYYKQLMQVFLSKNKVKLALHVNNVEFNFKDSNNGIHLLNLEIEQGQLIGMVGRSGVGKSTLLNILNGNIKPQKGNITINGLDLYNESDNVKLEGIIGYVPQDDLLMDDLSVFTNLYLNAQLCFDNLPPETLTEKVNNLLTELNLYDVKDLKVGTPLNKFISGGQRKKLNMALELIRKPWILFADEPTSGLSSSDSEEIMHHLAEQTVKGCIVLVNIHQPSSDIFKLFDKIIVLDKGGHPAFYGNPLDAIPYFNSYEHRLITSSEMCNVCENINPETIFKVLEDKKVNEFGEFTNERKSSPQDWHKRFIEKSNASKIEVRETLPESQLNKPNFFKQFLIFSKRNLLSKLANQQYILLALLISPFLATLLAFLCRSGHSPDSNVYVFGLNENIPSYLFMSVIVALFVGLIISAEEIIRDRKILYRESYLKLSKASYINSKVLYLIALSAVQTLLFVLIGNSILGIHGMTLYFWVVLFAISCFANMLGLLISSIFDSVVVIYITVPLVMVPLILLSGVVVNFDKLNDKVSAKDVVPITGDVMASRWAYEALLVAQFQYNDYQKHFFETEKEESNIKFDYLFVIPEVEKAINELKNISDKKLYKSKVEFIKNELSALNEKHQNSIFTETLGDSLTNENINQIETHFSELNNYFSDELNSISQRKDSTIHALVSETGTVDKLLELKNRNFNNYLAEMLLKRKSLQPFIKDDNRIIRELEPVYQIPLSMIGRAQFLSSTKVIGNLQCSSLVFNTVVIWLMSLFFYLALNFFFYFYMKL